MNRGGFDIASLLMDSIRGQPKQVIYQDLLPLTEHTETVDSHVLRVQLPDFRHEDIRVRIDKNSMKVLVRCMKPLAQTTVARVELDFDVPKDADVEHTRGKFEQGWLSLSIPKKRIAQGPDKKEEEEIPKEKAGSGERKKKEEPMPKEEQKIKSKEEEDMPKKTDSLKEKIDKDKKTEEKTQEGSLPDDREQERKKQLDKAATKKDSTEEAAPSMYGEKQKGCRKRETREGKWEGANWRNKIEEIEEWLDGGLVQKLTASFESNKKLILAAAVGFSVGFLVSQKIRSRST